MLKLKLTIPEARDTGRSSRRARKSMQILRRREWNGSINVHDQRRIKKSTKHRVSFFSLRAKTTTSCDNERQKKRGSLVGK